MSVKYFSFCHSGAGPHDDSVFIFSACACVLNFTTLKTEIDGVEKKHNIHRGERCVF